MKRRQCLAVEELERRDTPTGLGEGIILVPPGHGGTPPPLHNGTAFVPPGVIHVIDNPNLTPPPVYIGGPGDVNFLPPGLVRALVDPNQTPPPVESGGFLPPAFVATSPT